jgi:hypothetical protein
LAALVASMALNVVLLLVWRRDARDLLRSPARAAIDASKGEAPSPIASEAPCAPCSAELDRCRNQGWELARRVLVEQQHRSTPVARQDDDADVGAREQEAALCAKGMRSLHDTWHAERDGIITGLRKSLGESEEQERNASEVASRMADVLDVPSSARDALVRDYRTKRLARMNAISAALGSEPPDLDDAIAAARGLFADEDALALRYGREAGRVAWRREQLEGRTVVLAIAAAMSDHGMEEAFGW